MPEANNNNAPLPAGSPAPQGNGCGKFLGTLILLAALAAVLYIFIIKPELEKRGIEVEEAFKSVKEKTSELVDDIKSQSSKAGKKAEEAGRDFSEKVEDHAEKAGDYVEEKYEKTTDYVKDATDEVELLD